MRGVQEEGLWGLSGCKSLANGYQGFDWYYPSVFSQYRSTVSLHDSQLPEPEPAPGAGTALVQMGQVRFQLSKYLPLSEQLKGTLGRTPGADLVSYDAFDYF